MDLENILLLSAFTINFFLTLLLYSRAKKTPANVSLILLAAAVTVWCASKFFFREAGADTSLIWAQLQYFFALFTPPTFLLFGLYFPQNQVRTRTLHAIIIATFVMTSLTLWPGAVIKEVLLVPGGEKQIVYGWAYYSLYVWFLPVMFFSAYYVLLKKYFSTTAYLKMQILYIFLGSLMTSLGAMSTNLLLPTLGYFDLSWMGQLFTVFWICAIAYAIIKHRLLDIRLVVARAITNVLFLSFLGFIYSFSIFLFAHYLLSEPLPMRYILVSTVIALFVTFSFQPLKKWWEQGTDKIFFKGKYDTNELVLNLTKTMASTLRLEELTKKTLHELLITMRVARGAFILFHKQGGFQMISEGAINEEQFPIESAKKLAAMKRIIIFDEEEDENVKELMRQMNVEIIVPLYEDGSVEEILILGEKKSGEFYSAQDISVLEIFGPEMSVALHNAKSYETISMFNITLKDEIDKATQDLKAANNKLKELDVLKNEFVSVASHELRTPMTAIKSYLSMALTGKGGPLNEKQRYYIQRGYNSVERLIRLVNDMLNISRIESGKITINLKSFDLLKLTQEVVDEVLPRATEVGVKVSIENAGSLPLVLADADKIKEVLFNLIGNSLKFTPEGGSITVSFQAKGGFIETSISDTGVGITSEDIGKLFQKFSILPGTYTTNQTAMGTGLGLFICRSIIELHKGKIQAQSEGPGKGTTFLFTLKIASESDV